jgi:hypothetical protein
MMLNVRRTAGGLTIVGFTLIVIAAFIGSAATGARALDVVEVPGNPTCAAVSTSDFSVKDDPPTLSGFSNGIISIAYADERTIASVTAADGYTIDAVIVKAGSAANVYTVGPYVNLIAPLTNGGTQPAISHVEVCYSETVVTTTTTQPTTTTTTSPTTTTTPTTTQPTTTTTAPPTTTTTPTTTQPTTTTTTPTTTTTNPTVAPSSTTTTTPSEGTLTASTEGTCLFEDVASYSVRVRVEGPAGSRGVIQVGNLVTDYVVFDTGVFQVIVEGQVGDNAVSVVDDAAGAILEETVAIEDCTVEVLGTVITDDAPDVAVLGVQIEEPGQLPFTGPADGPIAAVGTILIGLGALLLLTTSDREERTVSAAGGWKLED